MEETIKKLIRKNGILSIVAAAFIIAVSIGIVILGIYLWASATHPKEEEGVAALAYVFVLIILIAVALIFLIVGVPSLIMAIGTLIVAIRLLLTKNYDPETLMKKKRSLTFINVVMYIYAVVAVIGSLIAIMQQFNVVWILAIIFGIVLFVFAAIQSKNLRLLKEYIYSKE